MMQNKFVEKDVNKVAVEVLALTNKLGSVMISYLGDNNLSEIDRSRDLHHLGIIMTSIGAMICKVVDGIVFENENDKKEFVSNYFDSIKKSIIKEK